MPTTEKTEPKRVKVLAESEEPTKVNFCTDKPQPRRAKDRTEREEPSKQHWSPDN
jgi:hypothetical protein